MVAPLIQKIIKDVGGTLEHTPIVEGERVTPTSATVTILTPDGAALPTPVSGAAATVGSDGRITYTLSAANAATQADRYKVTWSVVYSSVTYLRIDFYDVVLGDTYNTVSESDVLGYFPAFKNRDVANCKWSDVILTAYRELLHDLRNRGLITHLLIRPNDFHFAHIYKTLELACHTLKKERDDVWDGHATRFEAKYSNELATGTFSYDSDANALLTANEDARSGQNTRLIR